jgi:hypothetical protein
MGYKCEMCMCDGRKIKADTDTGEYLIIAVDGSIESSGHICDPMPDYVAKCLMEMNAHIW